LIPFAFLSSYLPSLLPFFLSFFLSSFLPSFLLPERAGGEWQPQRRASAAAQSQGSV
jgi:hypothetical protein